MFDFEEPVRLDSKGASETVDSRCLDRIVDLDSNLAESLESGVL